MAVSPPSGASGTIDTAAAVDGEAMFLNGWLGGVGGGQRIRLVDPAGGATGWES